MALTHIRSTRSGAGKRLAAGLVTSALVLAGLAAAPMTAQADDAPVEPEQYTVAGHATSTDGTPLADVGITLYGPAVDGESGDQTAFASSDADGNFTLYLDSEDEPHLSGYVVEGRLGGYTTDDVSLDLSAAGPYSTQLTLTDGVRYSVSGTVTSDVDITGLQANLYQYYDENDLRLISTSTVDAAGNYTVTGASPDFAYEIAISDPLGAFATTFYTDENGPVIQVNDDATGFDVAIDSGDFLSGGVVVSGGTALGAVLTATPAFDPTAAYTYQWFRNGFAIPGAVGPTYAITAADQGAALAVRVTATKRGVSTATADSSGVVVDAAIVVPAPVAKTITRVTLPKVKGTAKVGKILKATVKKVSKAKVTYVWTANGKAISKATKSSLKLTKKLAGKKIVVKVTYKKSGYKTLVKKSKSVKVKK